MKKGIFVLLIALSSVILVNCNTPSNVQGRCNFTTVDRYVLCGGDTIAELTNVEYGMKKNGRIVKELTFTVLDNSKSIDVDRLIRYLTQHNRKNGNYEVEINFNLE
jgi:hypothetical protein